MEYSNNVKSVSLRGRKIDSPYKVLIQMVKHPLDASDARYISVHELLPSPREVVCLKTYGQRCPICNYVQDHGQPFSKWDSRSKNLVMFYGICQSEEFSLGNIQVNKGELVQWTMLQYDFTHVDRVKTQIRADAFSSKRGFVEICMNPGADFDKKESRCTVNWLPDEKLQDAQWNNDIIPLTQIRYQANNPSHDDLKSVFAEYSRIAQFKRALDPMQFESNYNFSQRY